MERRHKELKMNINTGFVWGWSPIRTLPAPRWSRNDGQHTPPHAATPSINWVPARCRRCSYFHCWVWVISLKCSLRRGSGGTKTLKTMQQTTRVKALHQLGCSQLVRCLSIFTILRRSSRFKNARKLEMRCQMARGFHHTIVFWVVCCETNENVLVFYGLHQAIGTMLTILTTPRNSFKLQTVTSPRAPHVLLLYFNVFVSLFSWFLFC